MLRLAFLLTLVPAAAFAHAGHGAGGFGAGLLHPVLGPDHLLAMVAVGLWAALSGGRAVWAYPAAFVGAMLVGGVLGAGGAALAVIEPAILASVIVIGALAAVALRAPLPVAGAGLAVFGLAHGYAHGLEGTGTAGYAAGFVIATASLHGVGLLVGFGALRAGHVALARGVGGAVALSGAALMFG